MAERHDAVALAGHLWRTPAAFRMYLRGLSLVRLQRLAERQQELPGGHREQLAQEQTYRTPRPWMQYGAVDS